MITVSGGCHCGAVRFRASLPDPPVPALDCNCSVCSMTGFLHVMVPHEEFRLEQGADELTSYRFGTGAAEHLFCLVCGVKSFYQPRSHPNAWSVNANCLDQPVELAVEKFDGHNWDQAIGASERTD
ncbi:GFA family protein [Sphingomonas sp. G124]|uniref:GFA family protein n=1 Tax=Sphingomonas cremea TaxID=2904799 RepID=A0A9X1QHY0_9SPHN|nr:GFA family protein [Sphingomonas cremea]MCF2513750.1 GFA family protein [Sphingomonas cremea]